jgi:hypothetical protein
MINRMHAIIVTQTSNDADLAHLLGTGSSLPMLTQRLTLCEIETNKRSIVHV